MRLARTLALSALVLCLAAAGTPASAEGFKYSDVMKGYLPGNKMIFVGLKKKTQRADVIAFLKQALWAAGARAPHGG